MKEEQELEAALEPTDETDDELKEQDPDDLEPLSTFEQFINYIHTKKGDVMLGRIVALAENLTSSTQSHIEALAVTKKESPAIEYKKWRALLFVRAFVVALSLVATIYLKQSGNLDSTTSLIIVTIATVFFTYGRKQQE